MYRRTADENSLRYQITHKLSPFSKGSLFTTQVANLLASAAGRNVEQTIAQDSNSLAKQLVEVIRKWDVEVKKALTAIKEAEVVGRGFKL